MLAVFSSPATSYRWARLYENANQTVFIDAHVQFFNHIGGVYKNVVYDNMRNVVSRFITKRKKVLNDELIKLSIFYGFTPVVTNPYRGNEKGHVENSVKTIRSKAFTTKYTFESLNEAQAHLEIVLEKMNEQTNIQEEQQYLKPVIDTYEYCTYQKLRVSKYSFIQLDNNFYSVPEYLVYKIVTVKKYLNFISILHANTEVCRHTIKTGFGEYSLDINHYLKTLIQKPGALPNSAALDSIPKLKRVYQMYYEGRERTFLSHLLTYKDFELDKLIAELIRLGKDDNTVKVISHNRAVDAARIQLQAHSKLHMKEGMNK
ncbi:Mu transposase domain-containing protein [Culicoidibacter larvae]|uniref:Transposase n=1 Tax=Culicoidibacter larvae TaxID=2579976 RepID=A0A5R8Q6R6_9FIRM|nr:DDE-type integrase/transposase/recombinase [Culicoidibacter larvae]TLG70283.1 transposase [Culicoidibacter larvae]